MSDLEAILLFAAIWTICGLTVVYWAGVLDRGSESDEEAPLPPSSMGREVGTVKNEVVNGFLVLVGIASTGVLLSFGAFYLGVFFERSFMKNESVRIIPVVEEVWLTNSGELAFVEYNACRCCPDSVTMQWGKKNWRVWQLWTLPSRQVH